MAYESMYEGDGFIRKGPQPKSAGKEVRVSTGKTESPKRRSWLDGGITMFRFTRLVFGR